MAYRKLDISKLNFEDEIIPMEEACKDNPSFDRTATDDIDTREKTNMKSDLVAEGLELSDTPNGMEQDEDKDVSMLFGCLDTKFDGLEIQRELRAEWDERDAALEKLLNKERKE